MWVRKYLTLSAATFCTILRLMNYQIPLPAPGYPPSPSSTFPTPHPCIRLTIDIASNGRQCSEYHPIHIDSSQQRDLFPGTRHLHASLLSFEVPQLSGFLFLCLLFAYCFILFSFFKFLLNFFFNHSTYRCPCGLQTHAARQHQIVHPTLQVCVRFHGGPAQWNAEQFMYSTLLQCQTDHLQGGPAQFNAEQYMHSVLL